MPLSGQGHVLIIRGDRVDDSCYYIVVIDGRKGML
jgi:hypothetical protein